MTDEKSSNDLFVSSLRQLLINCEPLFRDSDSIHTVQELLQRLEENDEHFYKYELVKVLKSQINDKLGKYIEETIEQYPASRMDSNHAEMIDSMTSKLISSPEYLKLSKKFRATVINATDYLSNNYDMEIGSRLKQSNISSTVLYQEPSSTGKDLGFKSSKYKSNTFKRSQQEAQAIFEDNNLFSIQSSDGESSSSSFFNPESCVFLNQDELILLAEDLDAKRKNFAKRQNAMLKLLKMPLVDIHCWDVLGLGLVDSLNEPELYNQAIKFIAKGLISTPNNVKALYCILARQLEVVFTSKKYQLPSIKAGIDIRQQEIQRILISMRLINEFQLNAIHFWVRYSEKFVEDIMDCTLKLFSVNCKSFSLDSKPTPLHFLSIIDPKAEWMIKWTHGTYSRIPLLRYLEKYKSILEDAVKCCIRFFSSSNPFDTKVQEYPKTGNTDSHCYYYSTSHLDYLFFLHSLSVIVRTVIYKGYRALLERVLIKENSSIQSFMCQLMVFGFKQQECGNINYFHLDPHNVCFTILKNVVQDETSGNHCFCNMEFLCEIVRFIRPLNTLQGEELKAYADECLNSLCQLSELLLDMIQYASARQLFLTNPKTILMPQSTLCLIGEIIHKNLKQKQVLPNSLLIRLISIICQLYNGSVELHTIWKVGIHVDIIHAWKEATEIKDRCSTPTKDKIENEIFEINSWEELLSENLLLLAKTRRGVIFLDQNDAISCCCRRILEQIKSTQSQIEPSPVGNVDLVINHISSTTTGVDCLVSMGYVKKLLVDIWSITESDADDLATYHPRIWSIQVMDTACLKPLVKLIAIHSSYSAFCALISGKKLPMSNKYSFRDHPKTLIDFIDRLVIINKASKIQSLFNYESSHLCGLYWLSATITNLNALLLLQAQYQFIECLIQAQSQNVSDEKDEIIIDALSIERNNIILKASFLAGPSERHLISKRLIDTLEQDIPSVTLVNGSPASKYFICLEKFIAIDFETPLLQFLHSDHKEQIPNDSIIEHINTLYIDDVLKDRLKHYTSNDLMDLIETVCNYYLKSSGEDLQGDSYKEADEVGRFSEYENIGISMVLGYGKNLKFFENKEESELDLSLRSILSSIKNWMNVRLAKETHKQERIGFDWFASSIFLLSQGDQERATNLLGMFVRCDRYTTLWPVKDTLFKEPNQLLFHVCHWVELIVAAEAPAVYSSFQICGYPISEVCSMWLSQCFLNIFNWSEVAVFLTSSVVMGPTFPIYFCVALLKHLEPQIKARLHNNDLTIFIREAVVDDFFLREEIEEILRYRDKYDCMICGEIGGV